MASHQAFAQLANISHHNIRSYVDEKPLPEVPSQLLEQSKSACAYTTSQLLDEVRNDPVSASKSTVLYLAYGSNLCASTFRGVRGIRPLSKLNIVVPSLTLTFDLPGLPYSEPCFANTKLRDPNAPPQSPQSPQNSNSISSDYRKSHWHKGLVGVVYEVTEADYATIIKTEGGGAAYSDIVVDCHPIPPGSSTVEQCPTTPAFKAHTLFCPAEEYANRRSDPEYAQASARYLKLITDGAEENALPEEYKSYLYKLRPYTITTKRQMMGAKIFVGFWGRILLFLIGWSRDVSDENGKIPAWMAWLLTAVFTAIWTSYDYGFKGAFGDGERTIEKDEEELSRNGMVWEEKRAPLNPPNRPAA